MAYEVPEEPGEFSLPLSAERLQWQLQIIGWSHGELARRLDTKPSKITHWASGVSMPPNRVAVWLEMLARSMVWNAQPPMWNYDPEVAAEKHQAHLVDTAYDPPPVRRPAK